MGLDVYLTWSKDFAKARRIENEYNARSEALWEDGKKYEEYTEAETDAISLKTKTLEKEMGVGEYGQLPETEERTIELPSALYPNHLFKIGYFRSSYNQGGINHVLRASIGKDLHSIFAVHDDYYVQPNWENAYDAAVAVRKEYQVALKRQGNCGIWEVYGFHNKVQSEQEAMSIFEKEYSKNSNHEYNYSSIHGEFAFHEPYVVRGIINGQNGVYIITENADSIEDNWYCKALEIVSETCEWVMKQDDVNKYYLCWSG